MVIGFIFLCDYCIGIGGLCCQCFGQCCCIGELGNVYVFQLLYLGGGEYFYDGGGNCWLCLDQCVELGIDIGWVGVIGIGWYFWVLL